MDKYICTVCDYLYDPEVEDPGTPFDDLPEDWTCPICDAGKTDFEKED
jgi:rubredoxin